MKKVLVTFDCTTEQRERIISSVPADEAVVVFSKDKKDLLDSHIILGEPDYEQIHANDRLEWIQMTWAGTDKYTMNKGFPKKVHLTNMSGAFGVAMSEYAIGAILSMYRHFELYRDNQRLGEWKDLGMDDSLFGKTVLFIGTGDICANTARRLKAFETYNIGLKRSLAGKICGFDKLDLISNIDEYIEKADIVISSVPNKPETRMLLNKQRLLKMKKDATLLNMGRGTLLDVDELNEVMDQGHLKYVILDVTNPEPLPANHPLWKQKRALITPHISGKSYGHCPDTSDRIANICCENLTRYFKGESLIHEILDRDFEYVRE